MLNAPWFSLLALLAALFSIRLLCGFFFSSFFLSSPLLMSFTPTIGWIASADAERFPIFIAASPLTPLHQ